MKVHKNDIEQIKRYCEETGLSYLDKQCKDGRLIEIRVVLAVVLYEGMWVETEHEKEFITKVQQACIRRNRVLDNIIKGER